jgi:hypothetical protein
MSKAATKVKQVLQEHAGQITLAEIQQKLPELKANELSMALCHYRKQGYLTRELVDSDKKLGRKRVWTYTYHTTKQPKETS